MITKLTSANDLEFFAPRFQEITEALAITNDATRAAVATAVSAEINNHASVNDSTMANAIRYLNEVVSQKKVRSINKEALMDAFTSALVEHSVESLNILYADDPERETKVENESIPDSAINTLLPKIEFIANAAVAKAQEVGLVIDSLETYFSNLDEIKSLQTSQLEDGKFLLVMPADEPYFEIDANTRVINIPNHFKKNGVGVYGDHLAELIVFKIDRYFDSQDFMNTKIAINWNFTPSGSRIPAFESTQAQAAFAKDDELEPGYVVFGFFITKEMTPSKGLLSFSVTCYNTDNNEISYSFNTQVAQLVINDSLTLIDPSAVKSVAKDALARLQSSSYTPAGVSPIDEPVWQLGAQDEEGKYLGLPEEMNFNIDNEGNEDETLTIVSQAFTPGLNTMKYTWYSAPDDGTVEMLQSPDVVTRPSDYFITTDLTPNEESVYYKKNELGKFVVITGEDLTAAWNDSSIDVYELGSSYDAVTAGRYQVDAQASKITVRQNGTYIKTVSNLIHSNVCVVPPAAKPIVTIEVASALDPETDDFILEDENTPYKFIATGVAPIINAVVTSSNGQPLGAIALEAIKSSAISELDAETIEQNTKTVENPEGKYEFSMLPESGEKQVNADNLITEDQYQVRAINRRNHTYSVSEPSEIVTTSFVASKITALTVKTLDGSTWVTMLDNGQLPADAPDNEGKAIELNRNYPTRKFVIYNNTDSELKKYGNTKFIVEEVNFDDETGEWKLSYEETAPEPDEIKNTDEENPSEIILDETYADEQHPEGGYTFNITRDAGIYRIRTENSYHGTKRIGYTDVFKVTSVLS